MKSKANVTETLVGAVVDAKTASAFAEKCLPHSTADVIRAIIYAVVNGRLTLTKSEIDEELPDREAAKRPHKTPWARWEGFNAGTESAVQCGLPRGHVAIS